VSKVLLDKDDDVSTASDRARLAYQVVQHLTAGEGEGGSVLVEAIREHSSSIEDELGVIEAMKVVLQRQNTLRPIFAPLMKVGIQQRKNASALRRLLTAAMLDYDTLKALWEEGKDKFEETVNGKLSEATEDQRKEICKLLSDHFDPTIENQIERKPRGPRKNSRRISGRDKDQATSSDIPSTPETTPSVTSTSSPSKSNGIITPQEVSPKHEPSKQEPLDHPVQ